MRVAAIDLGSNSFHMLVAELQGPGSFASVIRDKMTIQLGKTALATGRLDASAMERGLRCLDEFRRMALARRVERTLAVATSAIREAANGPEFLRRAREESGLPVRVISGREEARLIHAAVARSVDLRERALLVDIGGGSVELTCADATRIDHSASLALGFLRLHARLTPHDPMTRGDVRAVADHARASLAAPLAAIARHGPKRVIGTSGSITTLLRLAQQRRASPAPDAAPEVTRDELRALIRDLGSVPVVERARRFDLDPLRSPYLPIAFVVLDAVLEGIGADRLTVCEAALREGLIYDLLARTRSQPALPRAGGDLRLRAILDLAARCEYPIDHSHRVAQLAVQIFRQTHELHGLGEREERLLEYAALLHDIGYHIGYAKHHKHAYYLVMNSDLRGFNPDERAVLANVVRYHRRAAPRRSHPNLAELPAESRRIVKELTALLRVADGLDMSHYSIVEAVRCRREGRTLRFRVTLAAGADASVLDLPAARKHARYLEKRFGVIAVFTVGRPRLARGAPGGVAGVEA